MQDDDEQPSQEIAPEPASDLKEPPTQFGQFSLGARVRVNESFPYGYHGRTGTVIEITTKYGRKASGIRVRFDDNPTYPVGWHHDYFDVVPDGIDPK